MMDCQHFIAIVEKINAATLGSSGEDIAGLFDDQVTFVSPDFRMRLRGKQACLRSYEEFRSNADMEDYHLEDTQADICDNTAVVTYIFHVRYTMGGKTNDDSGRDLLVFERATDGRWLVVWRTMIVIP